VATTHLTKAGEPKIVATCTLPLTGDRAVDVVVTEHATFEVDEHGLTLVEVAAETGVDWVRRHTGAAFRLADGLCARAGVAAA